MSDKDMFAVKHSGRTCDRRGMQMLRHAEIRVNAGVRRDGRCALGRDAGGETGRHHRPDAAAPAATRA